MTSHQSRLDRSSGYRNCISLRPAAAQLVEARTVGAQFPNDKNRPSPAQNLRRHGDGTKLTVAAHWSHGVLLSIARAYARRLRQTSTDTVLASGAAAPTLRLSMTTPVA